MATLWKADGPANGRDFSLEELQGFVGGYFEIVVIDRETRMVVNEDGHALGLPVNGMGTQLYDDMARRNGHPGGAGGHQVVGDVLVCDRKEVL